MTVGAVLMWNIGVLKYGKAGLKSSAPHTVSIQRPANRVAVPQNVRRFHGTVFRDEQRRRHSTAPAHGCPARLALPWNRRDFTAKRAGRLIDLPSGADQSVDFWREGRQLAGIGEIQIKSPVAGGWVVDAAGAWPEISRVLAREHHRNRAIIGQDDFGAAPIVSPVFFQSQEILNTTAIIGIGGLHDAFQRGGIDGGGRWNVAASNGCAGGVAIAPICGQDGDGVANERGGVSVGGIGCAG